MREMDLVTREEFEAQREIAVAAREEADRLGARLADIESRIAALEAGKA